MKSQSFKETIKQLMEMKFRIRNFDSAVLTAFNFAAEMQVNIFSKEKEHMVEPRQNRGTKVFKGDRLKEERRFFWFAQTGWMPMWKISMHHEMILEEVKMIEHSTLWTTIELK